MPSFSDHDGIKAIRPITDAIVKVFQQCRVHLVKSFIWVGAFVLRSPIAQSSIFLVWISFNFYSLIQIHGLCHSYISRSHVKPKLWNCRQPKNLPCGNHDSCVTVGPQQLPGWGHFEGTKIEKSKAWEKTPFMCRGCKVISCSRFVHLFCVWLSAGIGQWLVWLTYWDQVPVIHDIPRSVYGNKRENLMD